MDSLPASQKERKEDNLNFFRVPPLASGVTLK